MFCEKQTTMRDYEFFVIFSFLFVCFVSKVSSLECFACSRQDSNKGKCIKTTKQCEEFQDVCMTYIRWGVPPYWTPRDDRIYYISKDCARMEECEGERRNSSQHCKRDWYNDWACVECCSGDMCNFYVTLGSSNLRSSVPTLLVAFTGFWFAKNFL